MSSMICMQSFFILMSSQNIRFGFLLESPQWGDSNKYLKRVYESIEYNVLL